MSMVVTDEEDHIIDSSLDYCFDAEWTWNIVGDIATNYKPTKFGSTAKKSRLICRGVQNG